MGYIVVEEALEPEQTRHELSLLATETIYRVFVARNRRYAVTVIESSAPRETLTRLQSEGVSAWEAEQLDLGEPPPRPDQFELVLVQRDLPPLGGRENILQFFADNDDCFKRHLALGVFSFLGLEHTKMLCGFWAPDAGAVRTSQELVDAPMRRAWTADGLLP